jgi:hypothetical protein
LFLGRASSAKGEHPKGFDPGSWNFEGVP